MINKVTRVALFGMDVDGVLTDGSIIYGDSGIEIKQFNAHDGMGITLLHRAGIIPFIITGRRSEATARRALDLGIAEVHQGISDKLLCLRRIIERYGKQLKEVAYVGDDLSDIEIMGAIGFPIAVADAVPEVKELATFVTSRPGGNGAVREACEFVIRLNGFEGKTWRLYMAGIERGGTDE